MDVILHIGAHRTGTTSLQRFLHQNQTNLAQNRISFLGPRQTRSGVFSALLKDDIALDDPRAHRSVGRLRMAMHEARVRGGSALLISDENVMGSPRRNLHAAQLYSGLGPRLAKIEAAFGGAVTRVGIAVRSYDRFWASTLAYAIPSGHRAPDQTTLGELAAQPRRWRDVILDVAEAFPNARVVVWDFDDMIGNAAGQTDALVGREIHSLYRFSPHHNRSPSTAILRRILQDRDDISGVRQLGQKIGRYMPFAMAHRDGMQKMYNEDLAWLRSATGGQVLFVEQLAVRAPILAQPDRGLIA